MAHAYMWMCVHAGTGKTTTLKGIITRLQREGKDVVVCAPTGISCQVLRTLHLECFTIHSLFGLKDGR